MTPVTPFNKRVEEIAVPAPGNSTAFTNIPVPCTVRITPSGGSAYAQYTTDPAMAIWKDWAKGLVTEATEDVLVAHVIALRLVVQTGSATMVLVGGHNG